VTAGAHVLALFPLSLLLIVALDLPFDGMPGSVQIVFEDFESLRKQNQGGDDANRKTDPGNDVRASHRASTRTGLGRLSSTAVECPC